jgi:hypothetical protein
MVSVSLRCALAALALVALTPDAQAQQKKSIMQQLVGAWAVVSVDTVGPTGARTPTYGENPRGIVMFDAKGNYALQIARVGMPKFAADIRTQGTADENRVVVQGTIAHFGTYKVDEKRRVLIFHVVGSSYPNWEGNDQARPLTVTGDRLRWITVEATDGGTAEVVLRRMR